MTRRPRRPLRAVRHNARSRAHYVAQLDQAETITKKVGVGADYVRAQLARLDPDEQTEHGERIVRLLFAAGDELAPEPARRGGKR